MSAVPNEIEAKEVATTSIGSVTMLENTFECRALIGPETDREDSGFSALALRLSGLVSRGETREEALENLRNCFRDAILDYGIKGLQIPWSDVDVERSKGWTEQWVLVEIPDFEAAVDDAARSRAEEPMPRGEAMKELVRKFPAPQQWWDEG